jgi:hypothetical protein
VRPPLPEGACVRRPESQSAITGPARFFFRDEANQPLVAHWSWESAICGCARSILVTNILPFQEIAKMKTLNHSKAHVISQPSLFSSAAPTQSWTEPLRGSVTGILITVGLSLAVAAPAWAMQLPEELVSESAGITDGAFDPESAAHDKWRALMAQNATPAEGCFHASYPNLVWEEVDCKIGQSRVHPVRRQPADAAEEVTGNGHDYAAKAKGLITLASGGFATKGVKSEKSVGVAAFGGGGILGSNEYSLQVNTNANDTTSACAGHSGCKVWQQFVYSPDYNVKGEAAVFMQYWLIGWGSSACPKGWGDYGSDCYKNSAYVAAPDVPITDLGKLGLEGTATAGGKDSVVFSYGTDSYSITGKDSVLDISSVWQEAEFNVVGNAGGSRADFNNGSSIAVTLVLFDGSTSAPTCVANGGTTGETNNLNLGTCAASGGIPNIQFTESN